MMVWPHCALAALVCGLLALGSSSAEAAKPSVTDRPPARAAKSRKAKKPVPPPIITLEHLSTHHSLELQPSPEGSFSRRKMQEVSSFLRCHHTGKRHSMNERLVDILYKTARHYHNAKLFIVAGYRAPKIAKQKGNPRSPHKRGVAAEKARYGPPSLRRDRKRGAHVAESGRGDDQPETKAVSDGEEAGG